MTYYSTRGAHQGGEERTIDNGSAMVIILMTLHTLYSFMYVGNLYQLSLRSLTCRVLKRLCDCERYREREVGLTSVVTALHVPCMY